LVISTGQHFEKLNFYGGAGIGYGDGGRICP